MHYLSYTWTSLLFWWINFPTGIYKVISIPESFFSLLSRQSPKSNRCSEAQYHISPPTSIRWKYRLRSACWYKPLLCSCKFSLSHNHSKPLPKDGSPDSETAGTVEPNMCLDLEVTGQMVSSSLGDKGFVSSGANQSTDTRHFRGSYSRLTVKKQKWTHHCHLNIEGTLKAGYA